jgi:tRNA (cytidine56-2'-O)-methyltransferase
MHIFLTARALSASGVLYSGERDVGLERRINGVVNRWGGPFTVKFEKDWKNLVEKWKKKGFVCHLTMYGINIQDCLTKIPKNKDLLIVVGSQKVPKELFTLSDLNIAIGNQPHSEVAALAVFLDRLFKGQGVKNTFHGSKMKVIPQERSKKVI